MSSALYAVTVTKTVTVHGPKGNKEGMGWPRKWVVMAARRYSNAERPNRHNLADGPPKGWSDRVGIDIGTADGYDRRAASW